MRLNETIGEMTGELGRVRRVALLAEHLRHARRPTEPWGWQIDGHHLIVNCFVLGDQLVMTPLLHGLRAGAWRESGKYAGTRVFEAEEERGLALMQALDAEQRHDGAASATSCRDEVFTAAFRDNFELPYEGIRFAELRSAQQRLLLARWSRRTSAASRPGHAAVETGRGAAAPRRDLLRLDRRAATTTSVFYYRVHSPVILIEFDHQRGIALDNDEPTRNHIHTVVRTPNGNDYGKDLLRQHYAQSHHAALISPSPPRAARPDPVQSFEQKVGRLGGER